MRDLFRHEKEKSGLCSKGEHFFLRLGWKVFLFLLPTRVN